jgi:hypothetical protein
MTRLSKSVLSFVPVALTAGVLLLAVPRAAHAVAAAVLVQVLNTAANPAITQSAPSQAAQLVNLQGSTSGPASSSFASASGGPLIVIGTPPTYSVPATQSLVITDVDIQPNCSGQVDIVIGIETESMDWFVSGPNTSHFEYRSGTVFPPGSTPHVAGSSPACPVDVRMHGYLTSN